MTRPRDGCFLRRPVARLVPIEPDDQRVRPEINSDGATTSCAFCVSLHYHAAPSERHCELKPHCPYQDTPIHTTIRQQDSKTTRLADNCNKPLARFCDAVASQGECYRTTVLLHVDIIVACKLRVRRQYVIPMLSFMILKIGSTKHE